MRTNLWLFGIALVLGVLSGIRYCDLHGSYTDLAEAPRMFPGFTADRVSRVILAKMDAEAMAARAQEQKAAQPGAALPDEEDPIWKNQTVLQRESDKWNVLVDGQHGFPAAQHQVTRLLENLGKVPAARSDIVTDDPKRHVDYEVDEKQALHLVAQDKDGKPMAYLLVGRKPEMEPGSTDYTAGQGLFVRNKELNLVIRFDVDHWGLDAERNNWLDKNVLSLERDKVKSLEMVGPKGRWVVERDKDDKNRWRLKEPIEGLARASDVDSIVNYLSNLYMDELIAVRTPQAEARCGVGPGARYVVTAHMEDGQTRHTLRVGEANPDKEGQLFAVIDDKPFVVTIGKYIVETFRKTAEELRDLEAEKAEQEAQSRPADAPADEAAPTPGDPEKTEDPDQAGAPAKPGEPEPGQPER